NDVVMAGVRDGRRLWTRAARLSRVAWPGAAVGAVLAALVLAVDLAWQLRSGLGRGLDVLVVVSLALLAIAVIGLAVVVLRLVLRAWPALFAAGLLGPFVLLF